MYAFYFLVAIALILIVVAATFAYEPLGSAIINYVKNLFKGEDESK